mgnify:CR=1 FL=1
MLPIFSALSKCSTRIDPNTGWSWRATSPIAQTPSTLVFRVASTGMPLSTGTPPSATSVTGSTPTPTMAKSPSILRPPW